MLPTQLVDLIKLRRLFSFPAQRKLTSWKWRVPQIKPGRLPFPIFPRARPRRLFPPKRGNSGLTTITNRQKFECARGWDPAINHSVIIILQRLWHLSTKQYRNTVQTPLPRGCKVAAIDPLVHILVFSSIKPSCCSKSFRPRSSFWYAFEREQL